MSSRLHIFAMTYLCFLRKRIGAVGGDTILRRPRAIHTHLHCFIDVRKFIKTARHGNCHSPTMKTLFCFCGELLFVSVCGLG